MDAIIDRMSKAGIKVILGTPTYSIPPWMYEKHPEILATRLGEQKVYYGKRQNMDITSPAYRFYCERIIRKIISRYKDNPAVIGYQIDNETTSYGTAGRSVQIGFANYLKKKFGTVDALNKAWGLVYWGQLVGDWDELPPRDGIVNPGYKLEWDRYVRTIVTDFLSWQSSIVSEYKRPDQFIMHDFRGDLPIDVDERAVSKYIDVAGKNIYHDMQDGLDGEELTFHGDMTRSLKGGNYFVTETNAQTIGWDSMNQRPPYDNQLRLSFYSHVGNGADLIGYWHWHSIHYGQETYWKGVLSHDLEPNRVYAEVTRIAQENKKFGPLLANMKKKNKVAILYSDDSRSALTSMPFDSAVDYMKILRSIHSALYSMNIETDFVFPESTNFDDYSVIVIPALYVSDDALLTRISDFVKRGGNVVMTFKSCFCNEYSTVRWVRQPGPLREAAGFSFQEFSNLKDALQLKGDPFKAGAENKVSVWADMLVPDTATPLAFYDHPFFGKYPAVTRNAFGKGTFTYEGTMLSPGLQEKVLADVLGKAGLIGEDQKLPKPVRVKHGIANDGKNIHFYLNYSSQPQVISYPYANGADMLTGKSVARSQKVTLGPWDLAIVHEQ